MRETYSGRSAYHFSCLATNFESSSRIAKPLRTRDHRSCAAISARSDSADCGRSSILMSRTDGSHSGAVVIVSAGTAITAGVAVAAALDVIAGSVVTIGAAVTTGADSTAGAA